MQDPSTSPDSQYDFRRWRQIDHPAWPDYIRYVTERDMMKIRGHWELFKHAYAAGQRNPDRSPWP